MSALVLDAGALVAIERNDRETVALLAAALEVGVDLRTNAAVVAQVWRDGTRQARLARLLGAALIIEIDESVGRSAGELLGRSRTADVIDATVVLLARPGDAIVTSDVQDVSRLADVAGIAVAIIPC